MIEISDFINMLELKIKKGTSTGETGDIPPTGTSTTGYVVEGK